jgi:hypothetical protein
VWTMDTREDYDILIHIHPHPQDSFRACLVEPCSSFAILKQFISRKKLTNDLLNVNNASLDSTFILFMCTSVPWNFTKCVCY